MVSQDKSIGTAHFSVEGGGEDSQLSPSPPPSLILEVRMECCHECIKLRVGTYYDRQGRIICMECWGKLHNDMAYKIVKRTQVDVDVVVSTVWLGIDHQWGNGPPLIFETMVFGGEHDQDTTRYSTEAEALAGHDEIVCFL